jgi:hypothetical protein
MTSESTTITSREFNHDTGRAKRAAGHGPVYVTDRGQPAFVLLSYDTYRELTGGSSLLIETLCRTPGAGEIEFDPPRRRDVAESVDLD